MGERGKEKESEGGWTQGGRETGREDGGKEGGRLGGGGTESMSNKKEVREAHKWKDTASVTTLNMYWLHYLSLLVHFCIVLNQYTDHINMAFL